MKHHSENAKTVQRLNAILGRVPERAPALPARNLSPRVHTHLTVVLEFMVNVRGWTFQVVDAAKNVRDATSEAVFWLNLRVKMLPSAPPVTGLQAYETLFDSTEDIPHLTEDDVEITRAPEEEDNAVAGGGGTAAPKNNLWTIRHRTSVWQVEAKLVLSEADMLTVATLLFDADIPSGKTVQLQADAHIAGSYTWIGMIASFDDRAIPFATVSADIGCGLSIFPVCRRRPSAVDDDARQLTTADFAPDGGLDRFKTEFMIRARQALFRGKKSDQGDKGNTIELFDQALAYLGNQIDLEEFKQTLAEVLAALGILVPAAGASDPMLYASRFLQSLGSSGNHFIELAAAADDEGALFVVTHSGSRGLGAIVYAAISKLARLYSGSNVATGPLCALYRKAFEVLCSFARVNRILCAMAVLKPLDMCVDGETAHRVMCASRMFTRSSSSSSTRSTLTEAQRVKLLFGLTHNGIKTFVDHAAKEIVHVLSKGAVALSRRADIGIVALRAGEGCDLFVLDNPDARWVEVDGAEARACAAAYTPVFDLDRTDVCFAGHGAGRAGSATSTHKRSTYDEMIEYYDSVGFIGNLTPGVLGDNPAKAYKAPEEIRRRLPLGEAAYTCTLKTLVNHKEGMNFRHSAQFAKYCVEAYHTLDSDKQLWLDLGLVQGDKRVLPLFIDQREKIAAFLAATTPSSSSSSSSSSIS